MIELRGRITENRASNRKLVIDPETVYSVLINGYIRLATERTANESKGNLNIEDVNQSQPMTSGNEPEAALARMDKEYDTQLQMIWPTTRLQQSPIPVIPADYSLRTYQTGDDQRFYEVMELSDWPGWNDEKLKPWKARIPPNSWFMVIHKNSNTIVATAMGLHDSQDWHPFGGELGWVASDPQHRGKGLGQVVGSAVTARLLAAGYTNIHLFSEDFRLPALKSYLKLGYVPRLYNPEMVQRWKEICIRIDWPFIPDIWEMQ